MGRTLQHSEDTHQERGPATYRIVTKVQHGIQILKIINEREYAFTRGMCPRQLASLMRNR